ncbi:MAG: polyphenol oxidase family protein [Chthoniobacterales bacterium]
MEQRTRPIEQFAALTATGTCRHAFVGRIPDVQVGYDKAEVLQRLDAIHRDVRDRLGVGSMSFQTAQQVHGNRIAHIHEKPTGDHCFPACDGLVTNQEGVCLGVYVADCCAVYLVDAVRRVIGLVHSGRKGTELAIASVAIDAMREQFGSRARDIVVQLSPCIRPPHYEIDFAAQIAEQCRGAGAQQIHDSGVCTACELGNYYSYRAEKGKTGRMLALLALR